MMTTWYLEGAGADGNLLLIQIKSLPFRVGRDPRSELAVAATGTSRHHARIEADDLGLGKLRLVDLGSTNGTFVNRVRIKAPTLLKEGDILHFGTCEFRLKRNTASHEAGLSFDLADQTQVVGKDAHLPEHFPVEEKDFLEMLAMANLRVAWQPIVNFVGRATIAYEVLGRGSHPSLPESPERLFALAATLGKEVALSEAFRATAAYVAARRGEKVRLFMNSHPNELFTEAFYHSIGRIQCIAPNVEVVMEVHETAAAEVSKMKVMAKRLRDLGVMTAYDDFGAGQDRLNQLAEIPVDVVKFDMSLIRGLHQASARKQQLVARLVHIVRDLGSTSVAEGVETEGEAQICVQMGFDLCQGYLTGRPELV